MHGMLSNFSARDEMAYLVFTKVNRQTTHQNRANQQTGNRCIREFAMTLDAGTAKKKARRKRRYNWGILAPETDEEYIRAVDYLIAKRIRGEGRTVMAWALHKKEVVFLDIPAWELINLSKRDSGKHMDLIIERVKMWAEMDRETRRKIFGKLPDQERG